MKIGIITMQKSPNYGACLQAFALYDYISRTFGDCEIIDLCRPTHEGYVESQLYHRLREKNSIFSKVKKILGLNNFKKKHKKKKKMSLEASVRFDSFNGRINYSKQYKQIEQLYDEPPVYDLLITGSDQVWNPTMRFPIEPYFLTFEKRNIKKISYASSLGIDNLLPNEKELYKGWLNDYYAVSVREQNGAELLSNILGHEIPQISDPTFLLSKEEWMALESPIDIQYKYILLFTLNYQKELAEYALHISKESGIKLIYLCLYHPDDNNRDYKYVKDAGPSEFLSYIRHADLVLTDSFHGSAFCLHLEVKNFFTYIASTNKRGSRIYDMYKKFNIEDHILKTDLSQNYTMLKELKIQHEILSIQVKNERNRCKKYLYKNINVSGL